MSDIRVVVAGQDAVFRDIARTACTDRGIEVVAEAHTCAELVDACERAMGSVVVSEDRLADGELVGALPVLDGTNASVVAVCSHDPPETTIKLLAAGVRGILFFEDAALSHVARAVRTVAAGGAQLHPDAARDVLAEWRALRNGARLPSALTAREREVLIAMADGLSTKATARRLSVAVKTVENHKSRIFDKLGVRTQAHAVSVALVSGLVSANGDRAPIDDG